MSSVISSVDRVRAALQDRGLSIQVTEFPDSTRTAAEAAAAIGTAVAQIVKSLLFLAGDRPVLALVSGANRLDPAALEGLTGAACRKADAEAVRRYTGYAIGGVPPAGFPHPIETYVDRDLLQYAQVWAAAGTPHHVFPISPAQLVTLTGAVVANLKS